MTIYSRQAIVRFEKANALNQDSVVVTQRPDAAWCSALAPRVSL